MTDKFRDWGHTGDFTTVAYYVGDTNCDHGISHHGQHDVHYGSGHEGGSHTGDTNIRHLGYHLAWYIHAHFGSQPVDVVSHSMGGLIIRYALAKRGDEHFPNDINVEDVVTMGTPHGGFRDRVFLDELCPNDQCDQMAPGSDFLVWLEQNAWDPNGSGGTDWSTFGSDDDGWVAADRAAATSDDRDPVSDYMGSCHKVWWTDSSDIDHNDWPHRRVGDNALDITANVFRRNCPDTFVSDGTSHYPVRRADLAITFGTH
jgi:pimeloyl-ACP methyl ester carboxylesterase